MTADEFVKTVAKRLAAADLTVRRHQGAGDVEWADLCATRRVWAEVARLLDEVDS